MPNRVAPFLAAACLVPTLAAAQEWNYQLFQQGRMTALATIKLSQPSPGDYRVQLVAGTRLDTCMARELKASVAQEGDEQVITMHPAMGGCPERRIRVKADGSGGRHEVRQADGTWQWDGIERGLNRK